MAEKDRASSTWTEMAMASLTADPYAGSDRLVSARLQLPSNPAGFNDSWIDISNSAREMWSAARAVLLYWTPERTEKAALARAADNAPPSRLSEEVQVLTAIYHGMIDLQGHGSPTTTDTNNKIKADHYLKAFMDCLLALERRAATVEARAFDLRLRLEFEETRRVMENSDAASALAELIKQQAEHPDQGMLAEQLQQIHQRLTPLEGRLLKIDRDGEFVADHISDRLAKSLLPEEKLKAAAGRVYESLATSGFAWCAKMIGAALSLPPTQGQS